MKEERFRLEALFIDFDPHDWQEAVSVVGKLMMDLGSIEEDYIQAMIDVINDIGPYIVVIPHLAIAHAAPATYVLKNDLVVGVFKEPICFGSDNDPVHIIIGLCALSPHSHLEQFQCIADIFSDEDAWLDFCACNTVEELYKLINGSQNERGD